MALFRLEDLLAPRAEAMQALDLSTARPRTKQEFEKLLAHIPEFRIKPEKVRPEEIIIGEDYSFTCRKETQKSKSPHRQYARTGGARDKSPQKTGRIVAGIHPISVNCGHSYPDPIPVAMQSVRILDLATVEINWKMLTVARPTSKQDDEFFTKLVELEKLRLKTRREGGIRTRRISGFVSGLSVRRIIRTNRSGVTEIRLPACLQCGFELCDSVHCVKFTYEDFFRQQNDLVDEADKNKDGVEPVDEEEEKRLKEENKKQVITSMKGTAMKMKQAKKQQQSSKRPAVKTS
ncbi:uncharacterized protein LOC130686555 [Daphnia carinata]|uniref:uncharacterized protein LOC130686555 n=1 Tax=Daphnia carinata TaxID=120202 RepID=UPI002580C284|nr:uncharacterized protein LOC130686555 [Daphnia carinata]